MIDCFQVGVICVIGTVGVIVVHGGEVIVDISAGQQREPVLRVAVAADAEHLDQVLFRIGGGLPLRFQIIREIGVNMIRGKVAGEECLRRLNVLHIDDGDLVPVRRCYNGVDKRICGRPVGEGHQPLLLIPDSFIFDDRIPNLRQGRLKGGGVLSCG